MDKGQIAYSLLPGLRFYYGQSAAEKNMLLLILIGQLPQRSAHVRAQGLL